MGLVVTVVDECLEKMNKSVFTIKELYELHDGDIVFKAFQNRVYALCKIGDIIRVERNLYKKSDEDELEEVEESKEQITEPAFGISEIGQGVVDYVNKLEKENRDIKKEFLNQVQKNKELVEKCNIENSGMYKNLEQQLQFLQLKFREKQQELINKIDVIKKLKDLPHITIEKHNRILKEQTVKSKKCIQELIKKIESYKDPVNQISKKLFERITTFKF